MATKKQLNDELRNSFLENVATYFTDNGEEVLRVNSNEIALPCVDSEGNDEWLVITFKVPIGSRDGDIYDGYSMAEEYKMKCEEKAEKARENAEKKAKKIAKDKAMREAKAKAKAEHENAI